jgi:hypothetical protein
MPAIDLDDYVAWLRAHGVPDAHLRLYREGAEAVLRQLGDDEAWVGDVHIEAAVQEAAAQGAPTRRQENLRSIGSRLQYYLDERREEEALAAAAAAVTALAHEAPPAEEPPAEEPPALELADVPRGDSRRARLARISHGHDPVADGTARGTMVDDLPAAAIAAAFALAAGEPTPEPMASAAPDVAPPEPPTDPSEVRTAIPPRSALAPTVMPGPRPVSAAIAVPFTDGPRPGVLASPNRMPATVPEKPLPGCVCRVRQDIYPDDYWSMWGKVYLFVTGALGFVLAMLWSTTASLAVGLGVAAIGALATATSPGWRCTDCRRWIERAGLDGEQRRRSQTRSLVFVGIGIAASIGCVIAVQRLRAQLAEERAAMRVLEDLKSLDDETGD